jgi:hypothetical protein
MPSAVTATRKSPGRAGRAAPALLLTCLLACANGATRGHEALPVDRVIADAPSAALPAMVDASESGHEVAASPPRNAAAARPCDRPSLVTRVGKIAHGELAWAKEDVLYAVEEAAHPSWDGATLERRTVPFTFPSHAGATTPWRVTFLPDNSGVELADPRTGKPVKTPAPLRDVRGDTAVDEKGRLYDVAAGKLLGSAWTCGPEDWASYSFSSTGRFLLCDVHGNGAGLRDIAAGWTAIVGDGALRLDPSESYAVVMPGPFEGYWGHVETKRKTIDKIVWDDQGHLTTKTIGERGDEVALVANAYAILGKASLAFYRACDDAKLLEVPDVGPASHVVSDLSFSSGGALLARVTTTATTVYKVE